MDERGLRKERVGVVTSASMNKTITVAVEGVEEDLAKAAIRLAGYKLPIKTKFVKRF